MKKVAQNIYWGAKVIVFLLIAEAGWNIIGEVSLSTVPLIGGILGYLDPVARFLLRIAYILLALDAVDFFEFIVPAASEWGKKLLVYIKRS